MNTTQTHMTFETALLSSGYVYDAQPGVYMKEEQNGVLHTYMQIDGDVWNYEKYDADDKVLMTKEFTLWSYFPHKHFSLFIMTDQEMSVTIYRGLFTDAEWEIIDEALSEYQDHLGEDVEQEQNYYSLQAKIYAIFKLTNNKCL